MDLLSAAHAQQLAYCFEVEQRRGFGFPTIDGCWLRVAHLAVGQHPRVRQPVEHHCLGRRHAAHARLFKDDDADWWIEVKQASWCYIEDILNAALSSGYALTTADAMQAYFAPYERFCRANEEFNALLLLRHTRPQRLATSPVLDNPRFLRMHNWHTKGAREICRRLRAAASDDQLAAADDEHVRYDDDSAFVELCSIHHILHKSHTWGYYEPECRHIVGGRANAQLVSV